MTRLPDIVWPENESGQGDALMATLELLGPQEWIAFVPNPRPHDTLRDKLAEAVGAGVVSVNKQVAFVLSGKRSPMALRAFFEAGFAEWAVLGFASAPSGAMITHALVAFDIQPAQRLLVFDRNTLTTVI